MYIFDTFSKYLFLGFKVHYVHFRAFLLKIFLGYSFLKKESASLIPFFDSNILHNM